MSWWGWALIAFCVICCLVQCYSLCVVSGRISREEEKAEQDGTHSVQVHWAPLHHNTDDDR